MHWHWPVASSMAPLYSLGQDDKNEVQQDFFGHATPWALTSCHADGTVNGTTAFHWKTQSK